MTMQLHGNAIIDTLIPYMNDIEEMYINVPRGSYIYEDSPYKPYYEKFHAAEQAIGLVSDVTGVSMAALYGAALKARKWYNRIEWQRCLPEEDANRLLSCMMEQYPDGRRWS